MRAHEFISEGPVGRWSPRSSNNGGMVKGALGLAAAGALGMAAANHQTPSEPVSQPVSVDPEEQKILALTMWGEARNQGVDGMRAVGHVIKNRAEEGKSQFGQGIKGVATAPHQFSAWNKNDPNRSKMNHIEDLNPNSVDYERWQTAQKLAADILTGRDPDPTQGSLYYHTTAVNPRWARNMDPVTKIGTHVFYNGNPT